MNADEVFTNLLVVSKLNLNDKISYDGITFNIRPHTHSRALIRYVYGETRHQTCHALKGLFAAAVNIVEVFRYRNDHANADRIAAALQTGVKGVRNLIETYRDDDNAAARLTMIANDVDGFLNGPQRWNLSLGSASSSPQPWTSAPQPSIPSPLRSSPDALPKVSEDNSNGNGTEPLS